MNKCDKKGLWAIEQYDAKSQGITQNENVFHFSFQSWKGDTCVSKQYS